VSRHQRAERHRTTKESMMSAEYLIVIREPEWDPAVLSPEQIEMDLAGHKVFQEAVAAAGQRITASAPLRPQSEATRIDKSSSGAVFTDGPFGEVREVVTGFYAFTADSGEQARELAALVPSGGWLELYPIAAVPMSADELPLVVDAAVE
jgi:hypothetical protein